MLVLELSPDLLSEGLQAHIQGPLASVWGWFLDALYASVQRELR